MKTRNIITRVFSLALAAFVLAAPMAPSAFAENTHATTDRAITVAQSTPNQPAQTQPVKPVFDGAKLYKEVFQHLRDRHITLSDPDKRAAWAAEWENKHANDGALSTEEGTDKAVFEMIRSLGQRFDYYNLPEANKAERQRFDATLVGIGAQLQLKGQLEAIVKARKLGENATEAELKAIFEPVSKISDANPIVVVEPMEGGPAEKAGLKAGDRIIKVDGNSVNGKKLDAVIDEIRGKDGTKVTITVTRDDGKGGRVEQNIDIVRAKVVSHVVRYKDLGDGIAHIRLSDFVSQFAEQEMADALEKAVKNNKAIILDLRGNGGGRLDAVETMGQFFLKQGTLLTIRERRGDEMRETRTVLQPNYMLTEIESSAKPGVLGLRNGEREDVIVPADMPVVVLVDEGSASASEILSGLLQANKRAIVVGKNTVGKGVGQQVVPLPFDRNIHVTTFEFLPGGAAMDWVGIIPEISVDQPIEALIDDKDAQLNAARKATADALAANTASEANREKIRQDKEKLWKERLEKAAQAASGTASGTSTPPAPKK